MAIVTITGSDVSGGSPSGGGVGGASNLTTAGAVPYVASAGVLTQAATGLFYSAGSGLLGVGTGSPVSGYRQTIVQPDNTSYTGLHIRANNLSQDMSIGWAGLSTTGAFNLNTNTSGINLQIAGVTKVSMAPTTGNLLLGTTTDGGYKLDIAASGSSGTLRVWDQTATVGDTKCVVRNGAGQTSNPFEVQNNGGTVLARIDPTGIIISTVRFISSNSYDNVTDLFTYGSSAALPSGGQVRFSSSASNYYTPDVAIGRNSAGVLEINNGTAGTLRDLLLRYLQNTGVTVATLPAAAAGNAGTRAYVTDANATTIGTTVAGGGSNKVMVWSDGTNWKIYAS